MSDKKSESTSGISPEDPRAPSTRFQSITGEDDGNDSAPSGTVRRSRPSAISTGTADWSPRVTGPALSSRMPAESSHTGQKMDDSRLPARSPASSIRQQVNSPDPISPLLKPKRPPMARKSSSKPQGPHKGQEFSVDDDPNEYESDFVQRHSSVMKTTSGFKPVVRRKPSTIRRRPTVPPNLPRVDSQGEDEAEAEQTQAVPQPLIDDTEDIQDTSEEEEALEAAANIGNEDDDEGELSDTESFTLADRQKAINETHPFGIRIWKPALYKKNRSVEKTAEGDIHSSPGGRVSRWLWIFNLLWTILFGWWLATAAALGALACFVLGFTPGAMEYGQVLWGLAMYLFYPFGQFVKLVQDEAYAEEDEGEGRSITEYEQWQSGDLEHGRLFFGPLTSRSLIGRRRASIDSVDENDSLLGRTRRGESPDENQRARNKRRLFGRGQWTFGRVIYFVFFYFLISPLLLLASLICWLLVFWIPMGKVTLLLFYHLRRHPLAMTFHSDTAYSRGSTSSSSSSSVLLCTYRAVGLKYWKYTIDGTNIFLINLIAVVLFAIFDYWILGVALGLQVWIVHPGFVFALALFSIIPLAYFIGQAVASISAQSSMGVGATINAFFSTIVEVYLYCVALSQGKGQLVEGSIIGSIFAGILFLPGLSMCFGAIKRKTQRFNVKSAGVTSTMLLFSVIAAFGPTLFYQIYGSHELNCHACIAASSGNPGGDCRRCYYSQVPAVHDRFFFEVVRPYTWFAAVLLFLSYVIGLWFTLRTHAAVIWNTEIEEKKLQAIHITPGQNGALSHQLIHGVSHPPPIGSRRTSIRDSQLYKRILGQSLKQAGMSLRQTDEVRQGSATGSAPPFNQTFILPPRSSGGDGTVGPDHSSPKSSQIAGLSEDDSNNLVLHVAEIAATAAAVAARDVATTPRRVSASAHAPSHYRFQPSGQAIIPPHATYHEDHEDMATAELAPAHAQNGGHDAPNWSRLKSAVILLGATILYAIIAEILVNTVDVVLESVDIDEKFLGITLFALVPNTTEFLNAISFAMNGNIALSMEIGSAYALQVCLLQIPALVLFSAVHGQYLDPQDMLDHTFNLIFPQWDMVTVILCVFLLSYMYGEGKSNYFKGSILVLTYLVIVVGFYSSGYASDMDIMGVNRFDTLAIGESVDTLLLKGTRGFEKRRWHIQIISRQLKPWLLIEANVQDHEAVNSDKFYIHRRPRMAVTDACTVHPLPSSRKSTPQDSSYPSVQLRHDQSPGISRCSLCSVWPGDSCSDLESVGFDVDSTHPRRWLKHDTKSRVVPSSLSMVFPGDVAPEISQS